MSGPCPGEMGLSSGDGIVLRVCPETGHVLADREEERRGCGWGGGGGGEERDRETESGETDRDRDRETETDRQTDRQTY